MVGAQRPEDAWTIGDPNGGVVALSMMPYDFGCPIYIPATEMLGPYTEFCFEYIHIEGLMLAGFVLPIQTTFGVVLALWVAGWIFRR